LSTKFDLFSLLVTNASRNTATAAAAAAAARKEAIIDQGDDMSSARGRMNPVARAARLETLVHSA
jgi:hypothetical protein